MTSSFSSPDVEGALLGCILLNSSLLTRTDGLKPEEFCISTHCCIFSCMLAMARASENIDLITLSHRLDMQGELDRIGGSAYIGKLLDGCVPESFPTYLRIIRDTARRRHLAFALAAAAHRAEDPSVHEEEIIADLETLSAAYRDGVAAERKVRFHTAAELAADNSENVAWAARPWVALVGITLAIGKVKAAGKTTLFTHLVRSVLDGAPFMGMATAKGPVVYLSEQSKATFKVALQRAGLLHREDLLVITWTEASRIPWPELVSLAIRECKRIGAILLVVDTIGQFTGLEGDAENNAGDALRAMKPLQHVAAERIGVLIGQHERKSGGDVEDSGRGSSAFAGAADIVINIRRLPGNGSPNLRALRALSRFDDTPAELTIELTDDAYTVRDSKAVASQQAVVSIQAVIPRFDSEAFTLNQLCEVASVRRTIGQEVVQQLVQDKRLCRIGKGHKNDPYRYYYSPDIHSAGLNTPYAAESNLCPEDDFWQQQAELVGNLRRRLTQGKMRATTT
jgi:hypothetical protein